MHQSFRIRPDAAAHARKKLLIMMTVTFLVAVGITVAMNQSGEKALDGWWALIPVAFMLLVFGFSIYRAVRRQQRILESYVLTITDEHITREQADTDTITISRFEIKSIDEAKKGGFVIRGIDNRDEIFVPRYMERYDELHILLNDLHPVTIGVTPGANQKRSGVRLLLTVVLFLLMNTVTDRWLLVAIGAALIAVMIWSYVEVQQNRNIERGRKRLLFFQLFIAVYVAARIWIAFEGMGGMR